MKRKIKKLTRFSPEINHIAKARAYYSYSSFSDEAISKRSIEDALLAHSGTPKITEYGLEPTPLIEGWWYTGVDEERIYQLIDSFVHHH